MKREVLEVDSVQYKVGDINLLTDVYLNCSSGEVVGILGRNGSGKSTLLQIILGEKKTYEKNIRINKQTYEEPFKAEKIAYLPQNSFLPIFLKLKKIIKLFLSSLEAQEAILKEEIIISNLDKKPDQLSGGERKLIEILCIMHLDAPFILLDEPFANLDPLIKDKIVSVLQKFSKLGKGIVIADHDYRNIIKVSDKIMLLKSGYCREIKDLKELESENYLPFGTI